MNELYEWVRVLSKERDREALLNIERAQLIREALAALPAAKPFYSDTLAAFGRQLSAWGEGLQERYGDLTALPADLPLESAHNEPC